MQPLTLSSLITRDPDIIAADMDGDTVMMSIERGEYLGTGTVGTRVWALLEQPISIQEVARVICLEFEVDDATCQADMLEFSGELTERGIAIVC